MIPVFIDSTFLSRVQYLDMISSVSTASCSVVVLWSYCCWMSLFHLISDVSFSCSSRPIITSQPHLYVSPCHSLSFSLSFLLLLSVTFFFFFSCSILNHWSNFQSGPPGNVPSLLNGHSGSGATSYSKYVEWLMSDLCETVDSRSWAVPGFCPFTSCRSTFFHTVDSSVITGSIVSSKCYCGTVWIWPHQLFY